MKKNSIIYLSISYIISLIVSGCTTEDFKLNEKRHQVSTHTSLKSNKENAELLNYIINKENDTIEAEYIFKQSFLY